LSRNSVYLHRIRLTFLPIARMLVVAYLVLFVFVMLFAWEIEGRYGRPRNLSRTTQAEHVRLAWDPRNVSKSAVPSSKKGRDFLLNRHQQRAARLQSLGREHHKMSLVLGSQQLAKTGPHPPFYPKSNPAKLALVPRDRSIPA